MDIMDMLDRRMNDRGKMWRHVYKVRLCPAGLTVGAAGVRLLRPQRLRASRSLGEG
jgi:hypothetical protein